MIFNLMINLLAARAIMRSKFLIMLFWILISWLKIWPPDRHCQILMNKFDLMNKFNFDLMKKWISISWNSTSWPWVINLIVVIKFPYKLESFQKQFFVGDTKHSRYKTSKQTISKILKWSFNILTTIRKGLQCWEQ